MNRFVRGVPFLTLSALVAVFALGCKGGGEQQPNPKPPAEAPKPPPPPKMEMAEKAPEGEAQAGAAEEKPVAAQVSPEAQKEADQLWTSLCSTCHGATGTGDGPIAAGFPVKPRDLQDPAWQKETTDENIAKVILEGGAAIGKSPLMPGNPQLKGKPEVVQALVLKIRDLGKK